MAKVLRRDPAGRPRPAAVPPPHPAPGSFQEDEVQRILREVPQPKMRLITRGWNYREREITLDEAKAILDERRAARRR